MFLLFFPRFKVNTNFLNTSHVTKLGDWVKDIDKFGKYKLCWDSQSNRNGFYKGCSGKKDTITIIKDRYDSNEIIGAFTDIAMSRKYKRQKSPLLKPISFDL